MLALPQLRTPLLSLAPSMAIAEREEVVRALQACEVRARTRCNCGCSEVSVNLCRRVTTAWVMPTLTCILRCAFTLTHVMILRARTRDAKLARLSYQLNFDG